MGTVSGPFLRAFAAWAAWPPEASHTRPWPWAEDVAIEALGLAQPEEIALRDPERQAVDLALVRRMARGDRAALAELYDHYAPHLLAIGARMLGDRREAEDMVHDVFLEAWRSADTYDADRGVVAAWLVLRMRSRTLDRLRSASRTRTVFTETPVEPERADDAMPAHVVAAERGKIQQALSALPAEQRRVLELGYFGGLSSSEIAAEVGISIGTVKSRTAAALSKLRAHFQVPALEAAGGEP